MRTRALMVAAVGRHSSSDSSPALVLDERRAALDPVAVVAVEQAVDFGERGAVDVAADDAVDARFARSGERRVAVAIDVRLCAGETRLHVLGERPIRPIEHVVQPMREAVQRQQPPACEAAEPNRE